MKEREGQGSRLTIQGIDISGSLGTEYAGVIGRLSDRLFRLLYLPMVHVGRPFHVPFAEPVPITSGVLKYRSHLFVLVRTKQLE